METERKREREKPRDRNKVSEKERDRERKRETESERESHAANILANCLSHLNTQTLCYLSIARSTPELTTKLYFMPQI